MAVKLILIWYSLILYGFLNYVALCANIDTLRNLLALEFNFGTFMLIAKNINSSIGYLIIPLLYWKWSNQLSKHFDEWVKLYENFSRTLGHKSIESFGSNLNSWNEFKIFKVLGVVFLLAMSMAAASYFSVTDIYSYGLIVMFSILSFLWSETCQAIIETLELLKTRLKCSCSQIKTLDFSTQELISSWMNLSNFIKSTCRIYSTLLFSSLASMTLLVMLSVHTLLTRVVQTEVDFHEYFHSIVILLLSSTNVYAICNVSHRTEKQVKLIIQNEVLWTRVFLCGTEKLIKIKQMLYVIRMTTPSICLFNFIRIDRPLMVNLLSVVATYLVVLIQFEVTSNNPSSFNKTDIILVTSKPL